MKDGLTIVQTEDGSNTIYNAQVGENYHSKHGALQESRHVFLTAGLKYFLQKTGENKVSVLEVGFGTGLNFLLTADYCTTNALNLAYTGIEAYPLDVAMLSDTGYGDYCTADVWSAFREQYPHYFQQAINLNKYCDLQIAHSTLLEFSSAQQYDVIYFDAFAAARQPEMWNEAAIAHTIQFLRPGGIFVTYAITGNLKRTLKALNCTIEKVPGAPGKREMLRATKNF